MIIEQKKKTFLANAEIPILSFFLQIHQHETSFPFSQNFSNSFPPFSFWFLQNASLVITTLVVAFWGKRGRGESWRKKGFSS